MWNGWPEEPDDTKVVVDDMTRGRTVIRGLWAVVGVLLVAAVLAATARDEPVQVAAQGPCVPATLPVTVSSFPPETPECTSSSVLPTSTTTPPAATPVSTTAVTTAVARGAAQPVEGDDQLVLPPGDYDRLAILTEYEGSGVRGQAGAQRFDHMWQVSVVAENLVPRGEYHFMVGRNGIPWPTPCMFVAGRSGRGMCTGRIFDDPTPPEMVALMGPSGGAQAHGSFL